MENDILFQITIFLGAAVLIVPVVKKLGMGSVLGYLVAGIIIGPFILGIVGREGQDIMHFAEFGVVMMLFLIGLELEPARLWRLRVSILGLGGLQVLITAAVFFLILILMGRSWNESVAIGLIFSLSSTAIVLQTLHEKGMLHTHAGQGSFSVLLFQDIAVIPILALLPLLATSSGSGKELNEDSYINHLPGWLQTLAVLGAVTAIILVGRLLIRPLLKFVASTHLIELFTATALLIVVAITVLMGIVGMSPALGTFLGGVILANSEYRHELESNIEPFKGLLLGLFFLAVGATIDFGLVYENIILIIGIVVTAMLVKIGILFLLAKSFKMETSQALSLAFGLAQVGEFAFLLISFSQQLNIFPGQTNNILIASVALTMLLTPLLILINEKLISPKFSKRPKEEKEHDRIDEKNKVIVAGFGRFGNVVGRFLNANGVPTTVLDLDSDRVELLRKIGIQVYYGDATRYNLLKAAGADDAEMIIITLDTPEECLETVRTVKKHFPNLHILVRAYDRADTYELMDEGIFHIFRETLDSSLRMGVKALQLLGFRSYQAQRAAHIFRKHDEKALKHFAAIRENNQEFINLSREKISELEEFINSDMQQSDEARDGGWDAESLREEIKAMYGK